MPSFRVLATADESQSNHDDLLFVTTAKLRSYIWDWALSPRTKPRDTPTARVSSANHKTVDIFSGGAVNNRLRLKTPMPTIVRLRNRNTSTVKSGESFSSLLMSTGVFRFLNS